MRAQVVAAAEMAGRVIQDIRSKGFNVTEKGDQGPVTEADQAADAILKKQLLAIENCGWLSEESADDGERLKLDRLWVVDPLDGTKEFVKGLPEYSVAIALVDQGVPVVAAVHNPATGETYSAERGQGAFKGETPVKVAEGRVVLASRSEVKRGEFKPFEASWDVREVGSIEYKLGLIGGGEAACTFSRGPKWEWDVCAGALIIEEAGGKVTDLFGNAFRFNQSFPKVRGVLAGAPKAYAAAKAEIEKLGASDRMAEMEAHG